MADSLLMSLTRAENSSFDSYQTNPVLPFVMSKKSSSILLVLGFARTSEYNGAAKPDNPHHLIHEMISENCNEKVWLLECTRDSGMKYGMQEARGARDWKNALVGGAVAGAALSLTEPNPKHDRVVQAAITGGVIPTAAEFLRNLAS